MDYDVQSEKARRGTFNAPESSTAPTQWQLHYTTLHCFQHFTTKVALSMTAGCRTDLRRHHCGSPHDWWGRFGPLVLGPLTVTVTVVAQWEVPPVQQVGNGRSSGENFIGGGWRVVS
jgi:hypothetical protein